MAELDKNRAEEIRPDVSKIVRMSRPPRDNLTNEENQNQRDLRQSKEIIIAQID